jgi:DNA polymerase-1
MYQHYVLDETSAHDLGHLTKVYLNAKEYKYKMNQEWKNVELATYPQYFDALCERVSVDVDYTLQLHEVFNKELDKPENACLKRVYKDMLIPAANFLSRVEQNGCLINAKYLDIMDEKYVVLLQEIMADVERLAAPYWDPDLYMSQTGAKSASVVFKPGSPAQMAWMVFDRLKLKPRVKKGRSTGKDILESIEDAPLLIDKVLEYRRVQKEHSTYVRGLLDLRDEDGKVRTNFTLHVTATGRLSSKEPNIQNQPSANGVGNIRKAFIATPGCILGEIDYSGAELRWLAFLSKDEVLLEIFREGRNLHTETATKMFGPHFTKQQKMIAKALNFGIAYGREAPSIADTFNISIEEAQGHIDNWFKAYPGAHKYLEWCAKQVELGNYLETPWGRRRRFGLVNPASLHSLQNEAKNFPIQSSSSDTLLWCCVQHEKELTEKGIRIIDLIHDSVLVEIPANAACVQWFGKKMNEWMTAVPIELFDCPVPFKTDFEIGLNWGDLGGTEFDYNVDCNSNECICIEQKDDTVLKMGFNEWYTEVASKEDRYPECMLKGE